MARRESAGDGPDLLGGGYLRSVCVVPGAVDSWERFPFSIPAVRKLGVLKFHPRVTYLVGENGSGKSTLIEAIAEKAGFDARGGTKNYNFATRDYEAELGRALDLARAPRREKDGYFLRAESFFNIATYLDEDPDLRRMLRYYGGKSLHAQSHGESFLALAVNRWAGEGLYIMDEPEAALSPSRQLTLLKIIDHHARHVGSQFVIATHSPILMAYPDATLYHLDEDGIREVAYEETEHYQITRTFLENPGAYLRRLFRDDGD